MYTGKTKDGREDEDDWGSLLRELMKQVQVSTGETQPRKEATTCSVGVRDGQPRLSLSGRTPQILVSRCALAFNPPLAPVPIMERAIHSFRVFERCSIICTTNSPFCHTFPLLHLLFHTNNTINQLHPRKPSNPHRPKLIWGPLHQPHHP